MNYKYGYDLSKLYYEEHKTLSPKRTYKTETGESLGRWIINQKEKYNKGLLSNEQINELEAIGILWKTENHGGGENLQMKFNRLLPSLTDYYNNNGNLLVPSNYEVDGNNLGDFIMRLRSAKRNAGMYKGQLTDENIKIFNNICMVWDLNDAQWEEMYLKAELIYKEYGTIISGKFFITNNDEALRKWLNSQKDNYGRGTLSEERTHRLALIGVLWDSLEENNWNECYKIAENYYHTNGDLLVPDKYLVNDIKFGRWIQRMRKAYNGDEKLKITINQINLLNNIGMVWDVNEANWDNMYILVKECYKLFENINLPVSFIYKNINIGMWLYNQRQLYKENKLAKDRIDRLQVLNIKWKQEPTNVSLKEKTIFYYIKKLFNDAESNCKPSWLKGKELDIFIPSLNLAIEYDGERWHKDVKKDINKNRLCEDNGIKLIRVREPNCPKLNGISIDFYLKSISMESLMATIQNVLENLNVTYALNNKINIDITKDYFEIVRLYLNASPSAEWNKMYILAKEYYKKYNNLLVPQNHVINEKNLGTWLHMQRQAYRPTTKWIITVEQINKLESIGMIWNINEYQFQKKYKEAHKYFNEHGNLLISNQLKYGTTELVSWIRFLRYLYKNSKISNERINKLNNICMIWDS